MSTYLLDTCAVLWWMADAPELGPAARKAIESARSTIVVSAASLWEIAIKRRRGRLQGVDTYLARYRELHAKWGFGTLPIEADDAVAAGSLALPHNDPFDRTLIVQARRLEAQLVTCDEAITQHVKNCVW